MLDEGFCAACIGRKGVPHTYGQHCTEEICLTLRLWLEKAEKEANDDPDS